MQTSDYIIMFFECFYRVTYIILDVYLINPFSIDTLCKLYFLNVFTSFPRLFRNKFINPLVLNSIMILY